MKSSKTLVRRGVSALSTGLLLGSLALLLMSADAVKAVSAYSTMTNTGGNSPRGKVCDTWNVGSVGAGTYVTIEHKGRPTNNGTLSDPYLHVFNSSGVQVGANDDGGTGYNSKLSLTWQTGYYIGASVYSSGLNSTYTLTITSGTLTKTTKSCGTPPKTNQTITFTNPGTRTYGTSFTLSASASSGLAVSFSSSTTGVCTVSGSTVTTRSTGTCSITASQSGNSTYNAAPNVTQSFTISKASQSITFGTLANRTYSSSTFGLSATATSGLSVSFTSQTTNTCSVSGSTVTMVASGTCTIRASQAGSSLYNAATAVDRSFSINKASQSITYSNPGQKTSQTNFTTSATATSGLTVAFASQTTAVCTTSGTTVSLVGVGTCTVRASQSGDDRYLAAANVDQSFTVIKADQSISFDLSSVSKTYGDADFAVSATADSGLTVAFSSNSPSVCAVSGSTVEIRGAGSCSLSASQTGSSVYNAAATVTDSFTVDPKALTAPNISIVTRPYNGTRTAGSVTLGTVSGLVGSEELVISPSAGDYSSEDVGSHVSTVTFSLANGSNGGIASNYVMAPASVSGSISTRPLVVTADDVARTADDLAPTFSVSTVGLVSGESVSGATFSFVTVSAGSLVNGTPDHDVTGRYTVTPTAITLGNGRPSSNYAITYIGGSYDVVAGAPKKLLVPAFSGSAASGQSFSTQPVVTVADIHGNRVIVGDGSTATVTASITAGTGGSLVGVVSAEAADGLAQFASLGLAGSTAETYTITYSSEVSGQPLTVATQQVTPSPGAPIQLSVAGNISAQVASAFSPNVDVDVLDAEGNVVTASSAIVTVVSSGGDLTGTKSIAASSGTASFGGLTLNAPVGSYTLTYSSPGLTSVTQSATVQAGPAGAMTLSTRAVGTRSGEAFTTPPAITITDVAGNAVEVAGNSVTATITPVNSTGALLRSGVESLTYSQTTDANGVATFSDLGIVGLENTTYEIAFSSTVNGVVLPEVRQLITVTQGPAHSIAVDRTTSGAAAGVAAMTQPRIKVIDRGGNLVRSLGDQITIGASGSSAAVSATSVTSTAGYATFSDLTLSGLVGTHPVTYSASVGLNTLTASETVSLVAGPSAALDISTDAASAASGQAFGTSPVVRVLDAYGNLVATSTDSVTATITSGTGSFVGVTTRPVVAGSATFTGLGLRGTAGAFTLEFTASGLASDSQSIVLGHGNAARLDISTSATGARAGSVITTQPTVRVLDGEGNLVSSGTGSSASVTVTSSTGSTLTGSTSVAASGGVANFSGLRLDGRTGLSYSLTFRSTTGGTTLTSAVQTITMATGDAVALRLERAAGGTKSGEVFTTQPRIEIVDVSGNLVSSSSANVTVSASVGATLVNSTTATATSGVATFSDLGISGTAGTTYTLTYASGSLTTVSHTVRVTPGVPVSLALVQAASSTVGSGATFSAQPSVEVRDSAGNRVTESSAAITVSVGAGATLVGSNQAVASAGLATFSGLGLNGVADTQYTLTFSSGSLVDAVQVTTVQVGDAVRLRLDTSGSTSAGSGVALSTQPVVSLRDSGNNVVTLSAVTVTATGSTGTTITNGTQNTANGSATFSGLAVAARAATYTITYSAPGVSSVSQTITIGAGNPARIVVDPQVKSVRTNSGEVLDLEGSVRIVDSFGNTVTTSTDTINISASTPTTAAASGTACSPVYVGTNNDKDVYKFTSTTSCNWVVPVGVSSIDVLAVGGGGGGGADGGGGGGGGELRYANSVSVTEETEVAITVGSGGVGAVWAGSGAANGSVTSVSWGGSPQFRANGGSAGLGWQTDSVAAGGSGGSGGTGLTGGAGGGDVLRAGFGCPSFPNVNQGLVGSDGPSASGSNIPLLAANFGGGGGGGLAANGQGSNTTSGRAGGAGGGGSGASHTANVGSTAGLPGVANSGGGGGGGAACGPLSSTEDGRTQRTAGGRGADGVVYIAYSAIQADVAIKLNDVDQVGAGSTLSVTASNGVLPLGTFRIDGRAYDYTLTYSASGLTSDTQTVRVESGTPSQIDDTVEANGARSGSVVITQPVIAIQDAVGNLVASSTATVSATVVGGNAGSVALGGTTQINAVSGVATFTDLTLTGTAGTYTIEYSADIGGSTVTTSASVSLEAGAATKLLTSGASASGAGATLSSFGVVVSDADDNTILTSVIDVNVAISAGPLGVLSGTTTVSAASGVATFDDLSIGGVAGTYTLTFTADGLTSTTRSVVVTAGADAYLDLTSFDSEVPSGDVMSPSPVVVVRDAFGNATSSTAGVTATLRTVDIAGTTTGSLDNGTNNAVTINASAGQATFSNFAVTGRATQQYRIEFTANGLTPVTGLVTVSAGSPTSLVVTQVAADATSSLAFGVQPIVELRDSGDNVVTSSTDTVTITSPTLTVGQGSMSAVAGVASFSGVTVSGSTTVTHNVTYSATVNGASITATQSLVLEAGAPAAAVVTTEADGGQSGLAFATQPIVEIHDGDGNLVRAASGTVSVAVAGTPSGTLIGNTVAPIVSGRASFTSLGLSGRVGTNYTLTFTGTVNATTFTATDVVTVSAGLPASISLTTPAVGTASGATFTTQPAVTVLDEGGNAVTGNPVTISATVSLGGTLDGTTTETSDAATGVATFVDLGISGASGSTYRITYTADGLPAVTQDVTVSTGDPTRALLLQAAAGARSGEVLSAQPSIGLVDSGGNRVARSGVTVSASISTGGSLGGTTLLATDANGEVLYTDLVVNGIMGTQYTLTFAADDNGRSLTSATQTIRAQLGSAAQIALVNTPTGTQSGVAFTTAPVIEIQDAGGNVIADSSAAISASVTKTDGSAGGSLEGTTTRNAVGGVATFADLGITGVAGQSYRITFSSGSYTSAHHDVTVSVGPASSLVITSATPVASAGVTFDPPMSLEIRDSGGNVVPSAAQIVASVDQDAALVGTTIVAASSGSATFSDLGVMDTAGDTPTVAFSVVGIGSVSQQVTVSPGPAARLVVVGENASRTARSGSAFDLDPKIRIEDAGGNLVDDDVTQVTATITQISVGGVATGVLVGSTTVTAVDGVATFADLGITGRSGRSYVVAYSASVNGQALTSTSESITVTAGDAVTLQLTRASVGTAVGSTFTVQPIVTVLDSGQNVIPSAGVDVVASVSAGGSLIGTVTVSATTGTATFTDLGIIGTAGNAYTVTYSAMSGASPVGTIQSVTQQITPRVGVPARLELTRAIDGSASGTPFTQQPIVTVVDAGGNRVTASNATLVATVAPIVVDGATTGVLSGTSSIAAADGEVRFTNLALTGKSDRDYTITFTAASLPNGSNTVTQVVRPASGAADSLGIVASADGAPSGAAFSTQPQIEVLDSAGNRALGSTRRVSVAVSAGGTLVGTTFADAVSGLVDFADLGLTGTAGTSYTLTFSSGTITSVTQSVTVAVGPPTQLVLTQNSVGTQAGTAFTTQPEVEIRDSGDNVVSSGGGSSLDVVASVDGIVIGGVTTGEVVGTATVSAASGVANFSDLGIGGRAGVAYTVRYSASQGGRALTPATQVVTPSFGVAAGLSIEIPASGAVVGERIAVQPRVAIVDAYNNVVTNSSAVVEASISDGSSLLGSTSRGVVNGRATYTDLSARGVAGSSATVTYSVGGLPAQSQTLMLLAGSPTRLVLEQPAEGAASGRAFTVAPRVVIADSFGNRTTSTATVSATVTQVAGSGSLTGTLSLAATNGAVTFADLGLDGRAGTSYTVRFNSIGLAATSQTIQVELGQPASIEFVQRSVGTSVGTTFAQQPVLLVKDAGGNPVTSTGVTVSATVDEVGGSLIGTTSRTAVNGYVSFTDLGIVGVNNSTYTVRYSVSATSTTQSITATTGPALSIQLSQASSGHTNGASFTTQPRLSLRDAAGNLVVETGASATATLAGANGTLIGTSTRPFIAGVAAFTNLGIAGDDGESYEITYASDGLFSVTESATLSAALTGLVPELATVSATVDGFRVDMTNDDPNFTVTAVASSGGRVSTVNLGAGVRRFIVSGIGPDTPARLTVTTTRSGYTTETVTVDGRSQLRRGLTPDFGTPTVTSEGFYVQINNYNSGYLWTAVSSAGGRVVISPSGRLTVTGLAGGVAVSATVTTTRSGYDSASATTSTVTTRQAAMVPTFATPTSLDGGFTVQVTNYDANFTYSTFVTPGGNASIDGSGLITVTDLPSGTAATVLLTTSRTGYSNGSAAVLGRSLGGALTPTFGSPVATATGWSVPIVNYDANFSWSVTATSGTAGVEVTGSNAAVVVTGSNSTVTITVSTARTDYLPASSSLVLTTGPGLLPMFGLATNTADGFTVPVSNFDASYTWSVSSSATTEIDGSGNVTVSASAATVTVTSSRFGETTRSASFTKGSNPALVPALVTVSASSTGFVIDASNYDASFDWSFEVSHGSVTRTGGRFTVTGLSPGQSAQLVVYTDKADHDTGNANITFAASANAGLTPTFGAPTATADGFTVQVSNYDSAFTWLVSAPFPADVGIDSSGLVTVRQIEGGSSSTVIVTTTRQGYEEGSAQVTGTASTGGGLLATFGVPVATADGYTVQVSNHDVSYTWVVTPTNGTAAISASGEITVTGLTAGQSSTVTVATSRTGRLSRSVDFTFGALNGDGSSSFVAGRVPTFGTVTPTADGFRVPISNYSASWTWTATSGRNLTTAISSAGVLTVSGLAAGLSDSVIVTSNASGYATGTAIVTGTALQAGTRATNFLSSVVMTALCPHGSPAGEGAANVNDLQAATRYSCYTSAEKTPAPLVPGSIGFYTGDLGSKVLESITFTSAPDFSERDPMTYSLWGCQALNRYCSIIVNNDSTGLSSTRGADSTRTFRNTRAFNFYRITFGSSRSTTNVVQIGEVALGGTSGLPTGIVPTFGTPTVSNDGFTVSVTNFSRLYTWEVSVPAPGRASIDASGSIRVENLQPNQVYTLTVVARRAGFDDGTQSLTVSTSNGSGLIPSITSVRATEDGLQALIENYDTPGFTWSLSTTTVSATPGADAGVAAVTSNGIVTVTGATPGATIRLSASTSRTGYLDGSNFVDVTVLNDLGLITFDTPVPLQSGYQVQISNYSTSDSNGSFEWRVTVDNGAIATIDNTGLITVSNLGSGSTARVVVTRSQVGGFSTSGSVSGRSIGTLIPEFGPIEELDDGFVVDVSNFDAAFTWSATTSAGVAAADWSVGRVTVSAVPLGSSATLTVSASRTGYLTGSASTGPSLGEAVIPEFSVPVGQGTGFTSSINNWATVSATTWTIGVSPAGTVVVDGSGQLTVTGAVRGGPTTVTVTTEASGRLTGRGSVTFEVGARSGLTPSFGTPIPIVDGFTFQVANFNPDFTWSAEASNGATATVSATGLVTVVGVPEATTVTVTVRTERSGYQSGSATVVGSSRARPGLVPVFGAPIVTGTGIAVQIDNYDPSYSWSATVDNGGLVTISSAGRVTVTNLPGFTRATVVVTTTRDGYSDQTGTVTATTRAGLPLVPQFAISTSTIDGFTVRIRNFDLRYDWFVSSPLSGVVGSISSDGVLTVSGATTGALVPVEVRTERAGYQSGFAEFSAVARPVVENTLGALQIQQYQVVAGVATVSTSASHGLSVGDWVVVVNLSPSLDGEHRVTTVPSATQFTYATGAADTATVSDDPEEADAAAAPDDHSEQDESTDPQPPVEGDAPVEAPAEEPVDDPVDEPVDEPVDDPVDEVPSETPVDAPVSEPTPEVPVDDSVDEPTPETPVDEPVVAQNVVVPQAWVTPSQPAFVQRSETIVEVTLSEDGASTSVVAVVTIPSLVASDGTSMAVIAAMTEETAAGYRMVRIDGSLNGQDITRLQDVVRILFEPPAQGAIPVSSSDDGLTWNQLTLLSEPILPDGIDDGYYVNDDGTVWIFTRHLSMFGMLAEQAIPLDIVGVPTPLNIGDSASLTIEGGEGDGATTLETLTPAVCSVDELGGFTALTAGTCSLRVTKVSSGRYLEASAIETYTVASPSSKTPGSSGGGTGGAPVDDEDPKDDPIDEEPVDEQPDDEEPSNPVEPPADAPEPTNPGPSRPQPVVAPEVPADADPSEDPAPNPVMPPSREVIDAVSDEARQPVPPGVASPVVDAERPIVVIEDGEIVEVDVEEAPDGDGLVIRGDGFELLLRSVDENGNALPLDGDLRLVIERGRSITIAGEGYAPNSIVAVFLFSEPIKLGEIMTDESGSFSGVFEVPEDIEVGDHTVQINGVSPDGELRTVNSAIQVVETADAPSSGSITTAVVIVVIAVLVGLLLAVFLLLLRRRRISGPDASS